MCAIVESGKLGDHLVGALVKVEVIYIAAAQHCSHRLTHIAHLESELRGLNSGNVSPGSIVAACHLRAWRFPRFSEDVR
jgi:hypothetical protein